MIYQVYESPEEKAQQLSAALHYLTS